MKKIHIVFILLVLFLTVSAGAAGTVYMEAEKAGDAVIAKVFIKDNPGFAGYSIAIDYDREKLVPANIQGGEIAGGMGIVSNIQLADDPADIKKVTAVSLGTSNIYADGELFTVTFKIKNGSKGKLEFTLEGNGDDAFINNKPQPLELEFKGVNVDLSTGETSEGDSVIVGGTTNNKPEENYTPKKIFADVGEQDWFFSDVSYVYEKGLMKGTSEKPELLFSPEQYTNRAMFVTVLYRMEGEPETTESAFRDVEKGSYYEKAVAWAAENKIVNGVSADAFAPMADITREQAAKIIAGYAAYKKMKTPQTKTDISEFDDYSFVSEWAVEALQICADMNIIRGRENNTIDPQGKASRAETAAILRRFSEYNK
ncbi:MAG: S-layer homology domain-containing protein [Clostridia bacterium]|nr:S-layer homology domain-containing protein [Clostridia bacterium]